MHINAANLLTGLRALLIPVSAWTIATSQWQVAAVVFVAAVVTDLLDGPAARRNETVSPMGGLFDHGTDAGFVVASLGAAAWLGLAPALLPALIVVAFTQYVIDSGANRGRALRASWLGKTNGIAYFVLIGFIVIQPAINVMLVPSTWLLVVGWLLLGSTALSMLDRWLAPRTNDGS